MRLINPCFPVRGYVPRSHGQVGALFVRNRFRVDINYLAVLAALGSDETLFKAAVVGFVTVTAAEQGRAFARERRKLDRMTAV
ncbi:hypothetical protein ACFYT4_31620 [Streptomyces sp. NPDC004609]|uniref:hypothetical protein n=1 Tax=Streptomyces sp. NPDC004609 TaxID=3364704 RepID=UPI003683F4D5